jgi:hypothetical protein
LRPAKNSKPALGAAQNSVTRDSNRFRQQPPSCHDGRLYGSSACQERRRWSIALDPRGPRVHADSLAGVSTDMRELRRGASGVAVAHKPQASPLWRLVMPQLPSRIGLSWTAHRIELTSVANVWRTTWHGRRLPVQASTCTTSSSVIGREKLLPRRQDNGRTHDPP